MNNALGKILQEILQKEGSPSVKDFANMMGLSTRTVYNIFSGSTSMTLEQVVKAADILNADIIQEYYSRIGLEKEGILSEPRQSYSSLKSDTMTVNIAIMGKSKSFVEHFGQLVTKLKDEVQSLGFTIL
jgi:predicted transcriptional regulator